MEADALRSVLLSAYGGVLATELTAIFLNRRWFTKPIPAALEGLSAGFFIACFLAG